MVNSVLAEVAWMNANARYNKIALQTIYWMEKLYCGSKSLWSTPAQHDTCQVTYETSWVCLLPETSHTRWFKHLAGHSTWLVVCLQHVGTVLKLPQAPLCWLPGNTNSKECTLKLSGQVRPVQRSAPALKLDPDPVLVDSCWPRQASSGDEGGWWNGVGGSWSSIKGNQNVEGQWMLPKAGSWEQLKCKHSHARRNVGCIIVKAGTSIVTFTALAYAHLLRSKLHYVPW